MEFIEEIPWYRETGAYELNGLNSKACFQPRKIGRAQLTAAVREESPRSSPNRTDLRGRRKSRLNSLSQYAPRGRLLRKIQVKSFLLYNSCWYKKMRETGTISSRYLTSGRLAFDKSPTVLVHFKV